MMAVGGWGLASATRLAGRPSTGPLGARIARPTVNMLPAAAALRQRGFPATPSVARELGVAIEASVRVTDGQDGLRATCELRDLTAHRMSAAEPLLRLPPATTFTVLCWIRMVLTEGHRYVAIVRIWGPGVYAPLASRFVAFGVDSAAGQLQ
jgi:hypothetical protein